MRSCVRREESASGGGPRGDRRGLSLLQRFANGAVESLERGLTMTPGVELERIGLESHLLEVAVPISGIIATVSF